MGAHCPRCGFPMQDVEPQADTAALPQAVDPTPAQIVERVLAFVRSLELDGHSDGYEQGDCILELEMLARALEGRAQAPAPDWQPIESAPKTIETRSSSGSASHEYGPWVLGYTQWGHEIVRWWQTSDGFDSDFMTSGNGAAHPTHWMPLPAPPSTGDRKDPR